MSLPSDGFKASPSLHREENGPRDEGRQVILHLFLTDVHSY